MGLKIWWKLWSIRHIVNEYPHHLFWLNIGIVIITWWDHLKEYLHGLSYSHIRVKIGKVQYYQFDICNSKLCCKGYEVLCYVNCPLSKVFLWGKGIIIIQSLFSDVRTITMIFRIKAIMNILYIHQQSVCVCVCMSVSVCVRVRTHTCMHVCVCMYMHMHTCMCLCACMSVCVCVCMYVCTSAFVCVSTLLYIPQKIPFLKYFWCIQRLNNFNNKNPENNDLLSVYLDHASK